MKRPFVTGIFLVAAYGLLFGLTFAIGMHYYHAPYVRSATDAEFDQFQKMYDAFSYADEAGDARQVYDRYMAPDFQATGEAGTDHWSRDDEIRQAESRTTWQQGVKEKRWVESLVFSGDTALVRYRGDMTCLATQSTSTSQFMEHWTADDTWVRVKGHWELSTSAAQSARAFVGDGQLTEISLMPSPAPVQAASATSD